MDLTLSADEQELLSRILARRLQELLNEIAHTDHREFKQELLKDEKLIESLVDRLQGEVVHGAVVHGVSG